MAVSVQMPALGESVTEGTVTRWLKQEGDTVTVDEPLLEVSTDKVDTEIPAPVSGVLTKILAHEDDTVAVGGDLALIGEAGEAPAPAPAAPAAPVETPAPAVEPVVQAEPAPAPAEQAPAAPAPAASGTATSVVMPTLGESVTEGTVTRWLKKVGDPVAVDEPLVEVSTDKVDTEIPSPVSGTLLSITAEEDSTVPVGGESALSRPTVEIKLRDGRVLSRKADGVPGDPRHPIAQDQLEAKFRDCLSFAANPVTKQNIDRAIALINDLEQLDDAAEVVRILS